MSGNPFELPFPEILLLTGIRSDEVVNLETDGTRLVYNSGGPMLQPEGQSSGG